MESADADPLSAEPVVELPSESGASEEAPADLPADDAEDAIDSKINQGFANLRCVDWMQEKLSIVWKNNKLDDEQKLNAMDFLSSHRP
jgi:hypothetical protein